MPRRTGEGAARGELRDEQLILRFYAGDARALGVIYERWSPRVRGYFRRRSCEAADADDLVQETFVRVATSKSRGRFDARRRFSTWLFAVARNVAVDGARSRRLRRMRPLVAEPRAAQLADDRAAEGERVLRALSRCDAECRRLAELWRGAFGDRSQSEIARRWGRSRAYVGRVRERLLRTLHRELLGDRAPSRPTSAA